MQTFTNVDGSGIDVSVQVVGDIGQLTNNTPALFSVGGNNELRLFPNFSNTSQSVTLVLTFSQPVSVENLVIKDIDSSGFADAVRVAGYVSSGLDTAPNGLTLGGNIAQTGTKDFESAAAVSLDYTDPAGWVTTNFNNASLVDRVEITHYSGALSPANPAGQAVTVSDFEFFPVLPVSVVKTADTAGPVSPGDTIEYTVTVTNNGDSDLTDISIQDVLSALVSYAANSTSADAFGVLQSASASHNAIDSLVGGTGWGGAWQIIDGSAHNTIAALAGVGLQMSIVPGNYVFSAPTIERIAQADLSAASSLVLEFDLATSDVNGADFLFVYATSNGGATWTSVATYSGGQPGAKSIDLSAYASANSGIRFFAVGRNNGGSAQSFNIDNVNLIATIQGALTKDNNVGANPLTDGVPPDLVLPADALDIPPLESATITYSVDVGSQLDFNIANQVDFLANELSDPRTATLVIPMGVAEHCSGSFSGEARIRNNQDDGWWDSGTPRFGENEYQLGLSGGSPGNAAGIRFPGLSIPDGATDISATLTFTASSSAAGGSPSVNVRAVDSADAPDFGGSPPAGLTSANVDWNLGDWTQDVEYSIDVSAVVEELVADNAGLDNAAMAFILTATGDAARLAYDWDDNPNESVRLSGSFTCPAGVDSSDAPAGYGQATHAISASPEVYLGAVAPDEDATDLASANADGDDLDGVDDEDSVTFSWIAGATPTLRASVTVTNTTGGDVTVCGWLDRPPVGGAFGLADGFCSLTAGGTVNFNFASLPDDQAYTTYFRTRVSTDSLTAGDWSTAASDGEVEDYEITFDYSPTATTVGRVGLARTPVAQMLADLGVPGMDGDQLLQLGQAWLADAGQLDGASREAQVDALRRYLDPDGDGSVAVMRWDTLEERGTIGFYVERRSGGGDWQQVNAQLLPGLITAPMGGEYQLADPGAQSGVPYEYRLIELEARGTTREYGPFRLQLQ